MADGWIAVAIDIGFGRVSECQLDREGHSDGVEFVALDEVEQTIHRVAPQAVRRPDVRLESEPADAFQDERFA
jgi:hypothetical protein